MTTSLDTPRIASSYAPLVVQRLCVHARRMLGVQHAAAFVREVRRRDRMIAVAATDPELIGSRCHAGPEPVGLVMSSGRPLYVPSYRVLDRPLTLPGPGPTTVAAAPVLFSCDVRGVLSVWVPERTREFGLAELALLGDLAALVGHSLEHRTRRGPLRSRAESELEALGAALEDLDRQTADHVEQVVSLALEVGEAVGLSPVELIELELGARFHDVGKIRVPGEILQKPGRLSPDEWRLMRLHSVWGAEILAGIPGLEAVALVVRSHHERYDGNGYPEGLASERIPLAARIVSVCDAYSAMISDRPYSPALPTELALRELELGAGTQFDPRVAGVLARLIRREGPVRPSFADDLDDEALGPPPVELGIEDLLPRA